MMSEATASARVHPVRATTPAAAMTPTEPSASLTTSRKAARALRLESRPPARMSMETMLATRPIAPMTSMPSASISPGATRSMTARTPTTTPTTASMPA